MMSKEAALPNGTGIAEKAAMEGKREGSQSSWKNDSEAGWIVQKFGGTSVGKFAIKIAEDIVRWVFAWFLLQLRSKKEV
jgi:aspartate kinase